jgi:hypothetical protein
MDVTGEKKRAERYSFPPNAFDILQRIIMTHDNGRFMNVIVDRSSAKNFEKLAVWTEVTELFNKVSVGLGHCCRSFKSVVQINIDKFNLNPDANREHHFKDFQLKQKFIICSNVNSKSAFKVNPDLYSDLGF